MKKLKLESIEVTSFETSGEMPEKTGTVRGNQQPAASYPFQCPTDPALDCTYGCSHFTACPGGCVQLSNELVCA